MAARVGRVYSPAEEVAVPGSGKPSKYVFCRLEFSREEHGVSSVRETFRFRNTGAALGGLRVFRSCIGEEPVVGAFDRRTGRPMRACRVARTPEEGSA